MVQSHPTFPAYSFTDAAKEVRASQVKYGDDPDQILEFYGESDSRKPTLFLIHGGYWRNIFDREHMRPLAVALAKHHQHEDAVGVFHPRKHPADRKSVV